MDKKIETALSDFVKSNLYLSLENHCEKTIDELVEEVFNNTIVSVFNSDYFKDLINQQIEDYIRDKTSPYRVD